MLGKSLLVVDDDRLIREQLEKLLVRFFFTTFLAKDGNGAMDLINNENIDIVLLDVKLPDISGLDLIDKIRQKRPDCEIIIITGMGTIEIAVEALKKGAIDYIEKPIQLEELSGAIGRAQEKIIAKQALSFKNAILVVDDEETIVKHLERFFKKEGFEVFTANNGKKGLEIIDTHHIDVVVSDFAMDYINGIELLKRAKVIHQDIEFIIITGFNDRETAVQALRAGAIDYICKPIDLEELLISVSKAIERIKLNRNSLYRARELKISSDIIKKMNEELEKKIGERTTEIQMVQAQLFQTSKLATLGEMSAGLAHEINQPLTGISLVIKNIRKLFALKKLTEEELKDCLDDIDHSVVRMINIIKHIRTFARQDTLKFIQVDINEAVLNALNLLGEQLRLHEIETVSELSRDLPKIEGEPYQLEQVFINLISNARDAMDEKENTLNYKKRLIIRTYYCKESNTVKAEVEDNGTGIKDDIKEKVLQPFFTTKEVGKATGLGLSISYGIVESHKGKIELKSKYGEWTQVILTFGVL